MPQNPDLEIHQMMRTIINISIVLATTILNSCAPNSTETAHLRFGEFMLTADSVHLTVQRNTETIWDENLAYPALTDYKPLKPGKYTISVSLGEKTVLSEKFGLGKGQYFTLCAFGLPDTNLATNFRTMGAKMHRVFAGSEAHTPNGEKPKFKMLIDNFQKGEKEAQIRWAHFSPGIKSLSAGAFNTSTGKSAALSDAKYPELVQNKVLKPGKYTLRWSLNDGPQTTVTENIEIEPGTIYSFFVIGRPFHYADSLRVVVGTTPGK